MHQLKHKRPIIALLFEMIKLETSLKVIPRLSRKSASPAIRPFTVIGVIESHWHRAAENDHLLYDMFLATHTIRY